MVGVHGLVDPLEVYGVLACRWVGIGSGKE